MNDCYVVNLSHSSRTHKYVTFWRPNDKGYCYPLSWAGRYPHELVMGNLHYYNTGTANIAVPCSAVDPMAVDPQPGQIDGDAGPVVLNNAQNWKSLIASVIVKPPYKPAPLYRGARRYQREF